jgi:hypothetical protein
MTVSLSPRATLTAALALLVLLVAAAAWLVNVPRPVVAAGALAALWMIVRRGAGKRSGSPRS